MALVQASLAKGNDDKRQRDVLVASNIGSRCVFRIENMLVVGLVSCDIWFHLARKNIGIAHSSPYQVHHHHCHCTVVEVVGLPSLLLVAVECQRLVLDVQ